MWLRARKYKLYLSPQYAAQVYSSFCIFDPQSFIFVSSDKGKEHLNMSTGGSTIKPEPVKNEDEFSVGGYEDDEDLSPASVLGENGDEDEDVYEDSGDLDMAAADNKVWLVRIPKFLRDRWIEMGSSGQDLGTVRLNNPKDVSLLHLLMSM